MFEHLLTTSIELLLKKFSSCSHSFSTLNCSILSMNFHWEKQNFYFVLLWLWLALLVILFVFDLVIYEQKLFDYLTYLLLVSVVMCFGVVEESFFSYLPETKTWLNGKLIKRLPIHPSTTTSETNWFDASDGCSNNDEIRWKLNIYFHFHLGKV